MDRFCCMMQLRRCKDEKSLCPCRPTQQIAVGRGVKASPAIWLSRQRLADYGAWRFVGRDWFPGGLYTPAGRGSIPRRSTFYNIAGIQRKINRSS